MKRSSSFLKNSWFRTLSFVLGAIFAAGLVTMFAVKAVNDTGTFELDVRAGVAGDQAKKNDPIPSLVGDGNTTDEPAAGDDWANVYRDFLVEQGEPAPAGIAPSSAAVISFVEDTFANGNINAAGAEAFVAARTPEVSFFTGGGSKDTNGIQDGPWLYDTVNDVVPDKNDILNAFAALYSVDEDPGPDEDIHQILYFGLDTFSVNGAANAGFWFFRQPVGLNPLAPGATTGTFFGEHSDGDIFVAVAYTQGGRVGTIDVYKWVGDDATGSLQLELSGQSCAAAPAGDNVCGVINKLLPDQTFGEDPIFDYANTLVSNNPTAASSYQYESAAFVEFGLDLTTILGQEIGCFSTFLAETRSSQSKTAQLKDFAFGEFKVCGIDVVKEGDEISKVGDDVDYSITITNTGLQTLFKHAITDTLLGDLTSDAGCGDFLDPGESCTINVSRTVLAGDADPLPNTVTAVYREFDVEGALEFSASDDHSVELVQPAIQLTKVADTSLSKVGDVVNYTLTLSNNSSADTPSMDCSVDDSTIGLVEEGIVLASGESHIINVAWTVLETDPDPLVNTAEATCSPAGFENVLVDSDGWTVDLFQAAIAVDKSGDDLSKVGDTVDYTITLSNNSSADTPAMSCTATDSLLGEVFNGVLPLGDTVLNPSREVQAGDPDPLVNTVTLTCSPAGFPNVLEASDEHSTELFQASIVFDKSGDLLSKIGDTVNYTLTLDNTSSADTPDLQCTITDTILGINAAVTLASGAQHLINTGRVVEADDPDPLVNTANVSCSPIGFPNIIEASDEHSTNLFQAAIGAAKSGTELSKVGDGVDYVITLSNTSSADTPAMSCVASDSLLGQVFNGVLPLGDTVLNLNRTVEAGDPDPLVNTVTLTCSPDGFQNVLEASASHTTELFQPSYTLAKLCPAELNLGTGDARAWVEGETLGFRFTLTNTSSADAPDLELLSISDPLLGTGSFPAGIDVLSTGETHSWTVDYTPSSADAAAGGVTNSVSAVYSPAGFPNELPESDEVRCPVRPLGPATLIIEKVLLGGESLQFRYEVTGPLGLVAERALTPLGLPDGFATTDPDLNVSLEVVFGEATTYTVEELLDALNFPSEANFVSVSCTENDSPIGPFAGAVATLAADEDDIFVCRFVNEMKGEIIIDKVTDPSGDEQLFNFTLTGGPSALNQAFQLADATAPHTSGLVLPGSGYAAAEINIPEDWDLTSAVCSDDSPIDNIDVAPGEIVTCIFTDVKRGMADVVKRVSGALPNGQSFAFEIRSGADLDNAGTTVATAISDGFTGDALFTCAVGEPTCRMVGGVAKLIPGDYQMCETGMLPGWRNIETDELGTPLDPQRWFVPTGGDPDVDNSTECIAFTLNAGDSQTFYINDVPPPEGDARTIGFWKNWTSCDGHGNQDDVLDQTLAIAEAAGDPNATGLESPLMIGGVILTGSDCEAAVLLLDKRDSAGRNKKRAGDAAYGLAAQLLAAKLNVYAGANSCPELIGTINDAQLLLQDIGFDGSGSYLSSKDTRNDPAATAQRAEALGYAGELDDYNNNEPGSLCN